MAQKTKAELEAALKELERLDAATTFNKIAEFKPYQKQQLFFEKGATFRERMILGGNRTGKSETGAAEVAYHATGLYPSWWRGKRWKRPVTIWAAGVSGQAVRDVSQTKLLGPPGVAAALGSGFIPKSCILKTSASHSAPDAVDTVQVKHVSGGTSTITFKTYAQGRDPFFGAHVDVIWLDEPEKPTEAGDAVIFTECLARVASTGGIIFQTATPIYGSTSTVLRFTEEESPDRWHVYFDITDALHIPASERASIIAGYPAHERDARAHGWPTIGAGKIFTTPEDQIVCDDFKLPDWYRLLWSVDWGISHPFAGTLLAHDSQSDIIYVVDAFRLKDATSLQHAERIKRWNGGWGAKINCAWPQDMGQRREFEGALVPMADYYRKLGVKMLHEHATFDGKNNSTEAGILAMADRFSTGRLKLFRSCSAEILQEYRLYHRKTDGLINKIRDDLLSSIRVGVMSIRHASAAIYNQRMAEQRGNSANVQVAEGGAFSWDWWK
ncbi:MAG TPA: terminase family protein [Rhizomicrobium sp.]|nr:terminase family protein [Rhizomicrobium sp.]